MSYTKQDCLLFYQCPLFSDYSEQCRQWFCSPQMNGCVGMPNNVIFVDIFSLLEIYNVLLSKRYLYKTHNVDSFDAL